MPALTDKCSSPLLWFISAKRLLFFFLRNKDDDYVSVISFLGALNWIQISSLLLYQFVPALCLFFSFCYNCASNTLFKIWNLIEYPEYIFAFHWVTVTVIFVALVWVPEWICACRNMYVNNISCDLEAKLSVTGSAAPRSFCSGFLVDSKWWKNILLWWWNVFPNREQ